MNIPIERLQNQNLTHHSFQNPSEVVSHLGAVQAQDYLGSLWAVGLRSPNATESKIEQAISDLILPAGFQYVIRADAEGYIGESIPLDLRAVKDYNITLHDKNLHLEPIEEKAIVTLNSIFFDFDKATLKQNSMPELNRIINVLNERPTMTIEVAGHTDAIGLKAYNLGLSKRRSASVVAYLKKQGISTDRMAVKSFGESKPVATNSTAEGRKRNRRVEFEIIKE
ncbi:MAG: OmpA family protein [Fulvivirga sp.]